MSYHLYAFYSLQPQSHESACELFSLRSAEAHRPRGAAIRAFTGDLAARFGPLRPGDGTPWASMPEASGDHMLLHFVSERLTPITDDLVALAVRHGLFLLDPQGMEIVAAPEGMLVPDGEIRLPLDNLGGAPAAVGRLARTIDRALIPLGFTRKRLVWSKDVRAALLAAELRYIGPEHYEFYYGGWLKILDRLEQRYKFGYADLNMEYRACNYRDDRLRERLIRALNYGLDWADSLTRNAPYNPAAAQALQAFAGEPLTDEWRCSVMSELLRRDVVPLFVRMESAGTMRALKEMAVCLTRMTKSRD